VTSASTPQEPQSSWRSLQFVVGSIWRDDSNRGWRIWRLYLAGSAHGFANDWISLHQILAVRSGSRPDVLPMTRDYMYRQPA